MEVKLFEVRDAGTFIPVIAILLGHRREPERYLLRRCGYDLNRPNIMMTLLSGERSASCDIYHWNNRTLRRAHQHLYEKWDEMESGEVVDVEFIQGLTDTPKRSEREGTEQETQYV